MLTIPIEDTPSQTLKVRLGGQACTIDIYQKSGGFYCDLFVSGAPVIGGVLCHDVNRIVRDPYLGFSGDLVFIDTLGAVDPSTPGLGTRFLLLYLTADEVANAVTVAPVVKGPVSTFFTSTIYPVLVLDSMTAGVPSLGSGWVLGFPDEQMTTPVPTLQSGTLVAALNPVSYLNQRDVNPDTMTTPVPTLQSGTMVVTISYVTYVNQRDVNPDTMTTPVPTLQSGSLV